MWVALGGKTARKRATQLQELAIYRSSCRGVNGLERVICAFFHKVHHLPELVTWQIFKSWSQTGGRSP